MIGKIFDDMRVYRRPSFLLPPDYPVIRREKKTGMVVMFTGARRGVVLISGESRAKVGTEFDSLLDWFFEDLPAGTPVLLYNE